LGRPVFIARNQGPAYQAMLKTIRKMSLRNRLALLAGFAIVALVVASFVAWRLARATETFALRQADSSVQAAARDLARELHENPQGYLNIEQALTDPQEKRREQGPHANERRARPIPPHVETIFATYSDPLARLSAITLHRYPEVGGGFYRADGELTGYAFPRGASSSGSISADLVGVIRAVASETVKTGAPTSRTIQLGTDRVILASYPAQEDGLATAWAMQRLSHLSGVSDWPNLGALIALALSILAVTGLALLTVRDLRLGVTGIETGLAGLKSDLSQQLSPPDTTELARIAAAINELAASLRANIDRQTELERELRQGERLSALGRVVAGVAHEVRNPLAAIKLKVQLARRSSYPPEKLNETFNVINAEIERLDTLVRRLLELGGQQRLERSVLDLCELVSRRTAFFNDLATRAGVVIVTSSASNSLLVEGDANRLAQVVDNIIQNGLDAMQGGGRLTVSCDTSRDQSGLMSARVTFEDTGPGIQPADQDHIFEPFHTNRATGTGLGLAIARAIVEEHGGRLTFVSRVGQGASFVIELPLPLSSGDVKI
jgi:signal transduction histidine kinase